MQVRQTRYKTTVMTGTSGNNGHGTWTRHSCLAVGKKYSLY